MRRVPAVLGLLMILTALTASGVGVGLDVGLSTIAMREINATIDLYNDTNAASLSALSSAFDLSAYATLPVWRLIAETGVRMQFAGTGTDREAVRTTAIGGFGGAKLALGSFEFGADMVVSRASYDFPAAGYESMSGWGFGLGASAGYAFDLFGWLRISIAGHAQWLPIMSLRDAEGGVYQARDGAYLSFSGFGIEIGVLWNR